MLATYLTRNRLMVGGALLLALAAVTVTTSITLIRAQSDGHDEWSSFTMTYQVDGEYGLEVHRLEWNGLNDWRQEVLQASIDSPYGLMNRAGSYREVEGRVMVDYRAEVDIRSETLLDEGEHLIPPHGNIVPYFHGSLERDLGLAGVSVPATATRVCRSGACADNAPGVRYVTSAGAEFVFTTDSKGIPLSAPGFRVVELKIGG